jgi:glutamate 5-kinase
MIFPPTTCQRLIVKVGSALLVTPEGEVRRDWLTGPDAPTTAG